MKHGLNTDRKSPVMCVVCVLVCLSTLGTAEGARLILKDGRALQGKLGMTASLAEISQGRASDGSGPLRLILFLDDELRRTFISKRQVQEVREEDTGKTLGEKFLLRQRVLRNGQTVKTVGPITRIEPFDEYGRRIFTMKTYRGPVSIIQGITELTPTWTKVEGISHVWDMRMATSSIHRDVLAKILAKQIDNNNIEHRKKIARFYLQAERYEDANAELQKILADFPNDEKIKDALSPSIRALRQLSAQRLLSELKLRRKAGQDRLAFEKLKTFPSENVAGEILQEVRELIHDYQSLFAKRAERIEQVDGLLKQIKDTAVRKRVSPICKEITDELNLTTLDRLAAFSKLATDEEILPDEKLALVISGWLLGSNGATVNLPIARSAYEVRNLILQYLNESGKLKRTQIYNQLLSQEAASPKLVAKLLSHMRPPLETPIQNAKTPGYFKLEVQGLAKEPPVTYLVQLPPEYDPYRVYPTIVTLHGSGTTADQQVDWWAGARTKSGWRMGQATRRGYIVVAPCWTTAHQKKYQYSAKEHAAVLNCLRDACRRFSIDTNRVFLSGHSIGGDAAWDIGLAHPDLWAGVIPIVACAKRYCSLYWENAANVPFYFVAGEMDSGKMTFNAKDIDRYLKRGYNCTVVEYLGRGHEHFYDEILRIFDWMSRFKRDFYPRKFKCVSMRPWDNYFWWIEMNNMPQKAMVDPFDWPPKRGTLPVQVKASLTPNGGIYVHTGAGHITLWLSPELVDFTHRINIAINGQRLNSHATINNRPASKRQTDIRPDLRVMLEDARTRADRLHPFWAKVEMSTGR